YRAIEPQALSRSRLPENRHFCQPCGRRGGQLTEGRSGHRERAAPLIAFRPRHHECAPRRNGVTRIQGGVVTEKITRQAAAELPAAAQARTRIDPLFSFDRSSAEP